MSDHKRFDDYTEVVNCNECAKYWDSSCDGVDKDSKRNCNSYVATRSVVIPAKISALEDSVDWLERAVVVGFILLAVLGFIVGWLIG